MPLVETIAICISGLSLGVSGAVAIDNHRARRRQRATDVRLELRHALGRPSSPSVPGDTLLMPFDYVLTLVATNYGESAEYVTFAAVETADGEQGWRLFGHEHHAEEREKIEPRDTVTFQHSMDREELDAFRDGVVGVVRLASVGELRTKVEPLDDRIVDDVGMT